MLVSCFPDFFPVTLSRYHAIGGDIKFRTVVHPHVSRSLVRTTAKQSSSGGRPGAAISGSGFGEDVQEVDRECKIAAKDR